jgi:hypothetical protein
MDPSTQYDYCPVPECLEKTINVLDFSLDTDHMPDSGGEYTHASLLRDPKGDLPPAFTICSAFMVKAWTTEFSSAYLFQLNGADGSRWGYVQLWAASSFTKFDIELGGERITATDTAPMMFPHQWTRACLSLDPGSGRVRLVVDGTVLEDGIHQGIMEEDSRRPSSLRLNLGYDTIMRYEFEGRISDLNVFSSPLPIKQMKQLTTAGGEECGKLVELRQLGFNPIKYDPTVEGINSLIF